MPHRRPGERELLDVGGNVDGHDVAEAVQPPPLAPVHEPTGGAVVDLPGVGVAEGHGEEYYKPPCGSLVSGEHQREAVRDLPRKA